MNLSVWCANSACSDLPRSIHAHIHVCLGGYPSCHLFSMPTFSSSSSLVCSFNSIIIISIFFIPLSVTGLLLSVSLTLLARSWTLAVFDSKTDAHAIHRHSTFRLCLVMHTIFTHNFSFHFLILIIYALFCWAYLFTFEFDDFFSATFKLHINHLQLRMIASLRNLLVSTAARTCG